MIRLVALLWLWSTLALAADDPWTKVQAIKTGSELRIYKREAKQPVTATFDEATEERIVVVLKNEQVSIDKNEIDRIDSRPRGGKTVSRESKVTSSGPGSPSPGDMRPGGPTPGPSQSVSSGLSIGSKPDFETVYRRAPKVAPK